MLDKINEMLKGMDPKKLDEGIRRARAFAETPQGKDIISKIASNPNELANVSKNSTLSQTERDSLINELTKNPELLKKLKDFLQ